MALYPGAIHRLIPQHNKLRSPGHLRMNLHVAVSESASLHGFFSRATSCSHFYVRRDGTVEQYIDTAYRSLADYSGNPTTISVETQGGVKDADREEWTPEQVASLARLWAWARDVHNLANKLATDSLPAYSSHGLSYHRLGCDPWRKEGGVLYSKARGKICPGQGKINQIPAIFAIANGDVVQQPAPAVVIVPAVQVQPTPPAPPPAPVLPSRAPDTLPILRRGDGSGWVYLLQECVGADRDGRFGPGTEADVKKWQRAHNLVADGIVGNRTWMSFIYAAGNVLSKGSASGHPGIEVLQNVLGLRGADLDRIYGPQVEGLVIQTQRWGRVVPDGRVGPQTREVLFGKRY